MMQALKHSSSGVVLAATAVLVLACGGNREGAYDTTVAGGEVTPGVDTSATAMSPTTSDLPSTDPATVDLVLAVDNAEVEAGELARTKASNAQVKEFARTMVNEHGRNRDKLQTLRKSLGDTTAMGTSGAQTALQSEHSQTMSRLQSLSGAEFDRAYIESMVSGHEKVLNIVQQLQSRAQNPQLQQQLGDVVSAVQKHLDRARTIQGNLGGTASDTSQSD